MAYEKRDGSGAIFKNDNQREGKNDPGYKGDCMINGEEYWISAWVKDGGKGKFFSLSIQPKQKKNDDYQAPPDNADVPF